MVQYCVVPGCKSSALDPGISFHLFPQNPVMKKVWALKIRRDGQSSRNISSTMRICSQHFLESDYKTTLSNRKWLKKDVVPTLFSFNSSSTNRPQRRDASNLNSGSQDKIPGESETFLNVDSISSFSNELNKLHFVKKSTDKTYMRKFRNNSIAVLQRPVLNNISIPLLYLHKPVNLSSEIQNKEETLHQVSETEEDNSISLNSDPSISENLTEEIHFSYVELAKQLGQIHKPNSFWTLSCCKDFVMCAKWDATYVCQRRVVICEDLTVKVFVNNTKVILDSKVNSCESVSSLLQIVDEL